MCDGIVAEVWRPVVGEEGRYEVSNWGNVRSLTRKTGDYGGNKGSHRIRVFQGRPLAQSTGSTGRKQVSFKSATNRIERTRVVHRLVIEAFLGPCPAGHEVAHWDGNPGNNQLGNLRYASRKENMHDKRRHRTQPLGSDMWNGRLTEQMVLDAKRMAKDGYSSREIARIMRIEGHDGLIRHAVAGRTWAWLSRDSETDRDRYAET